jgi:hypothetical protein
MSARAALDVQIEWFDRLITVATAIVVIGVAGELLPALKKRSWELVWGLLVVLGVGGELVGTVKEQLIGRQLRDIQDKENQEQKTLIEEAKKDAEALKLQIAEEQRKQEEIRLEVQTAKLEAARATARAEAEALARAQLEQRVAPRRLTPKQQAAVGSKVDPFGGQKVSLVFTADIFEEGQLAEDVRLPLSKAMWIISIVRGAIGALTFRGILVEVKPDSLPANEKAAQALVNALRDEKLLVIGPIPWQAGLGQAVTLSPGIQPPDSPVRVTIGSR